MASPRRNPTLEKFLKESKAENNLAVSLATDNEGTQVVRLHDPNLGKFEIQFPKEGEPVMVIGRPGRSGDISYKGSDTNLSIVAKAVSAQQQEKKINPGVLVSSLGRAFGLDNVNVHDSRPGYSVSTHEGTVRAMERIHNRLYEKKDWIPQHKFPQVPGRTAQGMGTKKAPSSSPRLGL